MSISLNGMLSCFFKALSSVFDPLAPCRYALDRKGSSMKYAGLLVMIAGFFLTLAALILFPDLVTRAAFVVCGLAVELLGLAVSIRGHMSARGEGRL
jgi:hypothetical protein